MLSTTHYSRSRSKYCGHEFLAKIADLLPSLHSFSPIGQHFPIFERYDKNRNFLAAGPFEISQSGVDERGKGWGLPPPPPPPLFLLFSQWFLFPLFLFFFGPFEMLECKKGKSACGLRRNAENDQKRPREPPRGHNNNNNNNNNNNKPIVPTIPVFLIFDLLQSVVSLVRCSI